MRTELKKAIADLHAVNMVLQAIYDENAEALKSISILDDLQHRDLANWKYFKCLEAIFHSKKILAKIAQACPKVKKSKVEHIEQMTKADLLRNLLNMIGDRLEAVLLDPDDISIDTLLELQEVLVKLKENKANE